MLTLYDFDSPINELIAEQRLRPMFQPIIDVRARRILGHEALIRGPEGHVLEMPTTLFAEARRCNLLSELDLACRRAALLQYHRLGMSGSLFVKKGVHRK